MKKTEINVNQSSPTADWKEKDWNKFTNWLSGMLRVTTVKVTFTKKDGTVRVMSCTLDPSVLPVVEPVVLAEGKKPRKESTTSIRAYDTDINEWRSFTTKNVTNVEIVLSAPK